MDKILTVSQLSSYFKLIVDGDSALKKITVKGEVSNFTNHVKSGHFYFTLKDKSCSVKVIMFRSYAQNVPFEISSGMNVLASGSVRVFERDCVIQLYCEQLQPDGIGALYLAFEQLKEKLAKQGLFAAEHKRELPAFPRKIGVVTSKTGTAFQDILNILSRRYPIGTVTLVPALVQGDGAPRSICDAIELAQLCPEIDVLIVGRGGGSIEDLWAFNNEDVARAIYNCRIPVISAVGHEVDFTIADLAADLRAPTPSAAAELCAPDVMDLWARIQSIKAVQSRNIELILMRSEDRLKGLKKRFFDVSPIAQLEKNTEALEKLKTSLVSAAEHVYSMKAEKFSKQVSLLEALSPLKVMSRGYSISLVEDMVITSTTQVTIGDIIKTKVLDGEILSLVKDEAYGS